MTYPETILYLESFINYEKIPIYPYKESLKLERISDFLATINNPQDSLKCIHVAGSKGKGSTCAYITYILREAGYKVGLYTSPHLSDFRERIRVLAPNSQLKTQNFEFEGMISEEELSGLAEKLKPAIEEYNKNSKYGPLSFFEVYTSLAFTYFKEQNVDFAVLETGLGGRLDATNTVSPLVCAITPISFEHTQKLGNTLREIATEKAGIIKVQVPGLRSQAPIVISAPQEKEAMDVIEKKCMEVGAKLYEVGKDIIYKINNSEFSVKGIFGEYKDLKTHLSGEHQVVNAAVAIGVIEVMHSRDINVEAEAVCRGIHNTLWPGRCEVVSHNPTIVLDGAQNLASSIALKRTVKDYFHYKRLILVLGISKDKDIKGICDELHDFADEVILTRADNPRAADPKKLAENFHGKNTHTTGDVLSAKVLAGRIAGKEDLILVTGSLFVVGEFRNEKS